MSEEWPGLWKLVKEMGASEVRDLDISLPPLESLNPSEGLARGMEITFDDLDAPENTGGLISVNGVQALVYIPDQGGSLDAVLKNPDRGKKFHVCHCSTLISMAHQNRNHRYVATNDTSGVFNLTDYHQTRKERGALRVCRNCLKYLNYDNYRMIFNDRNKIYKSFSLNEFFSTYRSLFRYGYSDTTPDRITTPKRTNASEERNTSHEISWNDAFEFADSAFHNLMRIYQRQGRAAPEPGVPLVDEHGTVLNYELPLAWESTHFAVVHTSADRALAEKCGWDAKSLQEALIDSGQDG